MGVFAGQGRVEAAAGLGGGRAAPPARRRAAPGSGYGRGAPVRPVPARSPVRRASCSGPLTSPGPLPGPPRAPRPPRRRHGGPAPPTRPCRARRRPAPRGPPAASSSRRAANRCSRSRNELLRAGRRPSELGRPLLLGGAAISRSASAACAAVRRPSSWRSARCPTACPHTGHGSPGRSPAARSAARSALRISSSSCSADVTAAAAVASAARRVRQRPLVGVEHLAALRQPADQLLQLVVAAQHRLELGRAGQRRELGLPPGELGLGRVEVGFGRRRRLPGCGFRDAERPRRRWPRSPAPSPPGRRPPRRRPAGRDDPAAPRARLGPAGRRPPRPPLRPATRPVPRRPRRPRPRPRRGRGRRRDGTATSGACSSVQLIGPRRGGRRPGPWPPRRARTSRSRSGPEASRSPRRPASRSRRCRRSSRWRGRAVGQLRQPLGLEVAPHPGQLRPVPRRAGHAWRRRPGRAGG